MHRITITLIVALSLLVYPLTASAAVKSWPPAVKKSYMSHFVSSGLSELKGHKLSISKVAAKKLVVSYCQCTLASLEVHVTVLDLVKYDMAKISGKATPVKVRKAMSQAIAKCVIPLEKKLKG